MKKENSTDYNAHYASILSLEKEQGKINASDFLDYFSELIIKHSKTLEIKILNERAITNE
ncbi:hypothetical protein HPT25_07710 [Bacillus sp. BRMEA1]|uniref:hypothetical protein n=1 Tax=Neobacillus endophyticus TaxID=2738405 RepID=UPI001567C4E1|nr:hypothetical protein [Neobacillus endophyticus]NRD77384.1 hypothetical protein [Neobacillus endophyticus]